MTKNTNHRMDAMEEVFGVMQREYEKMGGELGCLREETPTLTQ